MFNKRKAMMCLCVCVTLGCTSDYTSYPPEEDQYVDCADGAPDDGVPNRRPDPDPCPEQAYRESNDSCLDCVGASLEYLRQTMDRYHGSRFWVYEDADSAGNHFLVWASFASAGTSENCPIVIHGDTRDGIPGGSASCVDEADAANYVKWHRYDAPDNGDATFSLCGSSFDTVLSIHQGCPGSEGQSEIACDDDACGQQSELTVNVGQDESYLIRVAGKGEQAGPYELIIDGPADPNADANLNCDVSVEFDAFTTCIYDDGVGPSVPSGATAIQFRLNYTDEYDFGGLVMNNGAFPQGGELGPNYGTVDGAGENLTGATALRFLARGEKGGEEVDFFVGGVGWDGPDPDPDAPHPGSTAAVMCNVTLTTDWLEYEIPLEGVNLSHVIGGFGWAANAAGDPDLGAPQSDDALIFYVDDIHFELDEETASTRLTETPRFLQSFKPRPLQGVSDTTIGDFDHRFRSVAFVYDNALALLAFLAEGTADGLRRARLIGDAFIHAAEHDRALCEGELRSAYSAGDVTLPPGWVPNGIEDEVRLAGFYNPQCQEYQELFADNISVGNTAWAMISLLALYDRTSEPQYLDAARNLGEFIQDFRDDSCLTEAGHNVGGFTGGLYDIEGEQLLEPFSSAEHNIDVYAAFTLMYDLTVEETWSVGAEHAKRYVWNLWDSQLLCFRAGTDDECAVNSNPNQVPVDIQAWAVLGIPGTLRQFPEVLDGAMHHHLLEANMPEGDGFEGFDFNNDRDGVWFEGTGHMAVALAFADRSDLAAHFRKELCRAQNESLCAELRKELSPPFDDLIGLPAGSHDGISTGFDYMIHQRLHVAPTAWNVFAQLRRNPYLQGLPSSDATEANAPNVER